MKGVPLLFNRRMRMSVILLKLENLCLSKENVKPAPDITEVFGITIIQSKMLCSALHLLLFIMQSLVLFH